MPALWRSGENEGYGVWWYRHVTTLNLMSPIQKQVRILSGQAEKEVNHDKIQS